MTTRPESPRGFRPTSRDVNELLERAARHPLGTDFLVEGALDAVAATFQVHAFVVDAARSTLAARRREPAGAPRG